MTDLRLREAERRFRASKSVDDETEWLRELDRAGFIPALHPELTMLKPLQFAAFLGHEPARRLIECPLGHVSLASHPVYCDGWHRSEQFQDHNFGKLIDGLYFRHRSGQSRERERLLVRASFAAAREVLGFLEATGTRQQAPRWALEEVRNWIMYPGHGWHLSAEITVSEDDWDQAWWDRFGALISGRTAQARWIIETAVRLLSEDRIRAALRRDLVSYYLYREPISAGL